jgi:DUF4097 and DUF4098 domain-containing protein YvlB
MKKAASSLLLAILVLAAVSGAAAAYRLTEYREWRLPAEERTGFSVRNVRGSIEVVGWDRSELMITATVRIRAPGKSEAQKIYGKISFEIVQDPGNKSITADVPKVKKYSLSGDGNTTVWVDYMIRVPHKTDLVARSVTGDITVIQVGGIFQVESEYGSIEMHARDGEGVLKTGSGDIGCKLARLPSGGRLKIKTGNGEVSLGVPADTSAKLKAKTGYGRVKVELEMTSVEKKKRKVMEGVLGGGDGEIVLESGSGDVTIMPLK